MWSDLDNWEFNCHWNENIANFYEIFVTSSSFLYYDFL